MFWRRRKSNEQDLEREIQSHLELEAEEQRESGEPPEEARYAAQRVLGNMTRTKEDTREVWRVVWLEQLLQDIRYGLRQLRRNPGFSAVVILTLALGIGMNTAVFSVVNAVLLRPLPYPDAERVVAYTDGVGEFKAERFKQGITGADFFEWREQAKSFDGLAAYWNHEATLTAVNEAGRTRVVSIAGDFWAITGAQPVLGRLFKPEEPLGAIVLSYEFFQRRFRGDPHIVGRAMILDGQPVIVAGILPPDFQFLFPERRPGMAAGDIEVYIPSPPLARSVAQKWPPRVFIVAKLKQDVQIDHALTELKGIQTRIQQDHPDRWFAGVSRMRLLPLQERLTGKVHPALMILQVAGIFVLLIACVNIANLLLARSAARRKEIAIRAAIGAGIARVLRQFLAEGLVLALIGGTAGLILAQWGIAMLARFGSQAVPRLGETHIDGWVLAFTLGVSLLTGIAFGLAPASSLWRANLQDTLKDDARTSSGGAGQFRFRRLLVAVELALAIVLLAGAGLMLKSFWRMYTNPPGFEPENTLTMRLALSGSQYADKTRKLSYIRELVQRLESLPGVQAAGIAETDRLLLQSKDPAVPNIVDQFQVSVVSPGYFNAIGMRLTKGSWIKDTDPPGTILINETMARRVFGDDDPVGQPFKLGGSVAGVVANLKYSKLDVEPGPEIYKLYSQNIGRDGGGTTMDVVVRMLGDPLGIAPAARKLISGIDPAQPLYDMKSLEQALAESIAPRRFNLFLLGTFAATALLMALVGIYGVIAYSVTQRTKEIGIRMALGAERGAIVRMVIRQGMGIALMGIVIGLAAALGLTRLMASLLYDVKPNDPFTFALVAVTLAITALLACWGPALKAAVIDPVIALRHE